MGDLGVIVDGAVLIRDGIVEEVGSSRRIENLSAAKSAREIDATGRIVMPAFADADLALTAPLAPQDDLRRMSKRRLDSIARSAADEAVRYGILTVGTPTTSATDLRSALKALRAQGVLQSKPLRIRSIFALADGDAADRESLIRKIGQTWMPAITRRKLANIAEIPLSAAAMTDAHQLALYATTTGSAIRMRIAGEVTGEMMELAVSAGAISVVGPLTERVSDTRMLSDAGCVRVVALSPETRAGGRLARQDIDRGTALAFGSGYRVQGGATLNPQYLLHLAARDLGLTAEEAIVAATYNAVCSLRLSHVTGSVEPGKSADLCVMDVGDYRDLARRAGHCDVSLVMRSGKTVYRRASPAAE